jgi:K(+)-stimulated pyrophosphate-energized sodium pump
VTEIGLILGINIAGLAFAVSLARWLSARDAGTAEMRRLAGAVQRAAETFLWREFRLVAAGAIGLSALVFALHAGLEHPGGPLGNVESGFWMVLGLLLGAGLACLTAHAGAKLAVRASVRTLAAARVSLDRALGIAARAGAATGLLVEAASVLSLAALFGLVYAMKGGFHLPPDQAAPLALHVAMLLPGFGFGAVAAALVIQRGGATYHVSSDVGGDLAGERDAGLEHDDTRNPAVVAELVGDHVGLAATRSVDLFVSATVANVTAVIVAAAVYNARHAELGGMLALVTLPLVVRSFGVIASGFGVMVVHTDDVHSPAGALWRGHLATAVVALAGLAGATIWLLGERFWLPFFAAGTIGVLAAAAVAHAARLRVERRFSALRDVLDSLRVGGAAAIAQGLGVGLQAAALPALVVGAAMAGAWQLGAATGLVSGGLLAALTALMAMLAIGPYVLAIGSFGPIADNARGIAAMNRASTEGDAERRTGRLDDAGFSAAAVAQTYLITVGCLSALLAAAALPLISKASSGYAGLLDAAQPAVVWSGALGAAVVLAYAGAAVRAAMRGARGVALEVERQLRGFPRERGLAQVPRDYTPSYRSCIDLTARAALGRVVPAVAVALLLPAALGGSLSLLYHGSAPGLAAQALAAFVVVATLTGLAAALVGDGARAALGAARRANRPRTTSSGFAASVSGDAVADVLGNAAGPAAHLFVKAVALTALAIVPFLT